MAIELRELRENALLSPALSSSGGGEGEATDGGFGLVNSMAVQRTLAVLDKNIRLHAYSAWYWSRPEKENDDEMFCVSPFVRKILATHREHFADFSFTLPA